MYVAPTSSVIVASPVNVITGAVVSSTFISKVSIHPFEFSKLIVEVPKARAENSPESVMVPTEVSEEDQGFDVLGVVVAVNIAVVLYSIELLPLITGDSYTVPESATSTLVASWLVIETFESKLPVVAPVKRI